MLYVSSMSCFTVLATFLATANSAAIDRIVPRHLPNKCLDLQHGDVKNGSKVVLWDCWDTHNQRWLVGDKAITLKKDTSKCIDFWNWDGTTPVKNGKAADGHTLQVWECNALREHHEWYYRAEDSTIRWKAPTGEEKCMDLFENKNENGALVGLWECNGQSHQRWSLGDGTGTEFIVYNQGVEVAWTICTVLLSIALSLSLCGNCFQRWRSVKSKNMEEEAHLPTTGEGRSVAGEIVGSPSQLRV